MLRLGVLAGRVADGEDLEFDGQPAGVVEDPAEVGVGALVSEGAGQGVEGGRIGRDRGRRRVQEDEVDRGQIAHDAQEAGELGRGPLADGAADEVELKRRPGVLFQEVGRDFPGARRREGALVLGRVERMEQGRPEAQEGDELGHDAGPQGPGRPIVEVDVKV